MTMLGICKEYAWNTHRIRLDHPWNMHEYAWNMPGICLEYRRNTHRTYMNMHEHGWNMHGIHIEHVWNMHESAWDMQGLCLGYAWNTQRICLEYIVGARGSIPFFVMLRVCYAEVSGPRFTYA